jgi:hypothetical protein
MGIDESPMDCLMGVRTRVITGFGDGGVCDLVEDEEENGEADGEGGRLCCGEVGPSHDDIAGDIIGEDRWTDGVDALFDGE